jgi:hypothetical protein
MDQTWNAIPQRKRRRPALACERCRQRKIKCDRNMPCGQCIRTDSEPCTYVPDDRVTKIHRPGTAMGTASGSGNDGHSSNKTPTQLQLRLPPTSQPQPQPQALPQPPTPAVSVTGSSSMDMDMVFSTLDLDVDLFPDILIEDSIDPQLPIVTSVPDIESGGEGTYHSSMVQAILQRMQHLEARLSETQMHAASSSGPTIPISSPTQTSLPTPKHEQWQQLSAPEKETFKGTFVKSRFYAQNHWRANISQVRVRTTAATTCWCIRANMRGAQLEQVTSISKYTLFLLFYN